MHTPILLYSLYTPYASRKCNRQQAALNGEMNDSHLAVFANIYSAYKLRNVCLLDANGR